MTIDIDYQFRPLALSQYWPSTIHTQRTDHWTWSWDLNINIEHRHWLWPSNLIIMVTFRFGHHHWPLAVIVISVLWLATIILLLCFNLQLQHSNYFFTKKDGISKSKSLTAQKGTPPGRMVFQSINIKLWLPQNSLWVWSMVYQSFDINFGRPTLCKLCGM